MSDDSAYRINNTMIVPLHDEQKENMAHNMNMDRHLRHRHRRRSLVDSVGGIGGICIFCSLFFLLVIQSSPSVVASSSPISSTKTIASSTGREKQNRKNKKRLNNPFRKEQTIVSGFGSRSIKKTIFADRYSKRTKLALRKKENEDCKMEEEGDHEGNDDGSNVDFLPAYEYPKMWVQRSNYGDKNQNEDALWIMIREDKENKNKKGGRNVAHNEKSRTVLKLSFEDEFDDWVAERATPNEESEFIRNHPLSEWIPVDGLYGAYRVPSGVLWILITGTEGIYEAPPIAGSTSVSNWWQIRRVTNLEIVHLGKKGYNQPQTITSASTKPLPGVLTASQLREEVRQLRLLRKALKQHDFYYVPEGGSHSNQVVRDMTKTIQRSILESDNMDSNLALSNKNKWWNDNDGANSNKPDSRFFWNQHAVEPILRRYQDNNTKDATLPMDSRKKYNQEHQKELTGMLLQHVVPVTSAFVGVQTNLTVTENDDGPKTNCTPSSYDEILISRRSRFRAGTRFTVRGADASGNCANFAETEQICLTTTMWKDPSSTKSKKKKSDDGTGKNDRYLQSIASHVQTRGSIPLRWSSPADIKTYRPRVNIGADPLAQARAVRLHILDQLRHYAIKNDVGDDGNNSHAKGQSSDLSDIIFVNLVDKHSDQGRLGRAFDAVLNAVVDVHGNESSIKDTTVEIVSNSSCTKIPSLASPAKPCDEIGRNSVKHVWYDFHAEVKNGRWDRLGLLLNEVKSSLIGHGYFLAHPPSMSRHGNNRWIIQRLQGAVVRTNCMDCLDRTNVVQSIFGRYMLFQQLSDEAGDETTASVDNTLWARLKKKFEKKGMKLPWGCGEIAHRLLWADNADAISRLYAGTPALKGDFTRTGKRTKRGALDDGMNSLQRYYLNNFLDADRQEGYDLLVGHAAFSNVLEEVPFQNPDTETNNAYNPSLSFMGATRESILSDLVKGSSYQHRRDLRRRLAEVGVSKQPDLDLRWLPGDLQTQLRDQTSDTLTNSVTDLDNEAKMLVDAKKNKGKFCSQQAMKAIDERSHADSPWWSKSDGDWLVVDDQGVKRGTPVMGMNEHRSQVLLTPTHLAFVFYLGFKAPSLLVGVTTLILSFIYFPECIKHDYRRQKSMETVIRELWKQKIVNNKMQ